MGKLNHLQEGELATLKEHQKALYCILQEFDRVCKTLGITYFLFAGTLLMVLETIEDIVINLTI